MEFFRAHQAIGTSVPTYLIESTAPDNVDDTAKLTSKLHPELAPIDSDLAVKQIAEALVTGAEPNLVVMVHGFNCPRRDVLRMYGGAATAIHRDAAIASRQGLVCVGYRWPSELMGRPLRGTWSALPTLPIWMFRFGIGVVISSLPLFYFASATQGLTGSFRSVWISSAIHVVTIFGWTTATLILTVILLRASVYFRDTYRASNYGIPDLIQLIRAIDAEIARQHARRGTSSPPRNVQLSFIGHSVGGLVVTSTIRTLSDVFAVPVETLNSFGVGGRDLKSASPSNAIGNVFTLKRFVLMSPDIPAEALLSNRGNFLASALSRFDEAYLFSNEGDEILRQISTLANYFVFPTNTRNHGFRLGNVEILSRNFGLIDVSPDDFLRVLRIGNMTLQELYDSLEDARALRQSSSRRPPLQAPLPEVFTYFDCTDYLDEDGTKSPPRAHLTSSKWRKRHDAEAKLRWYSHLFLLLCCLLNKKRPNVHNGYFHGLLAQQLIYRLACLGYEETVRGYGGEPAMGAACERKRIRVLVSPKLHAVRTGPVPPPAAAATMEPQAQAVPLAQPQTIDTTVPNLVGMSIVEARATVAVIRDLRIGQASLPARGTGPQLLLLEITRERPGLSPGTVLSQTPEPGSRLRQRTSIEVIVAR